MAPKHDPLHEGHNVEGLQIKKNGGVECSCLVDVIDIGIIAVGKLHEASEN